MSVNDLRLSAVHHDPAATTRCGLQADDKEHHQNLKARLTRVFG